MDMTTVNALRIMLSEVTKMKADGSIVCTRCHTKDRLVCLDDIRASKSADLIVIEIDYICAECHQTFVCRGEFEFSGAPESEQAYVN